jgi:hypothetical protein
MKNKTWLKTGVLASVGLTVAGVTFAFFVAGGVKQSDADLSPLAVLSRVSAPEMPAAAARLVAQASPEAREATAVAVVRAVNGLSRPSALPFVVGAISETSPSVAATVVGEASILQPDASLACVKAGTAAAPAQAAGIVSKVVQQQPAAYARVAMVAAEAAPSRSTEILGGLGSALPQIQPFLTRATAQPVAVGDSALVQPVVSSPVGRPSAVVDVPSVVAQVHAMMVSAAQVTPDNSTLLPLVTGTQKGPPVVIPLTPPVTPPVEKTVGDTVPQSGNGRDYSAP